MKKIVVTGSSGFVGRNLIPFLKERGFECVPFSVRLNNVPTLPSDVHAIIHLSGKAHDMRSLTEMDEYLESNYELTKSVFDIFSRSSIPKFIFLSSVKAVADVSKTELDENHERNPKTPYGHSKMLAEKYIEQCVISNKQNFYILRPCMIHGPGNKGNLNLLYRFVKLGIPYPLAAFKNQRSFLSVDNLNFVINEILLRDDIASGAYNIADDETLPTNCVIDIMNGVLGKSNRFLNLPPNFVRGLAKIGDLFYLPFNSDRLQKLTENYVVSNRKIKAALGKNLPTNAVEGLRKTIESFANV